jgi:hypothetical protein
MKTNKLHAILFLIVLGFLTVHGSGVPDPVQVSIGFESEEGYEAGEIDGQQEWTSTGMSAQIVSLPSAPGTQALELAGDGDSWVAHPIDIHSAPVTCVGLLIEPVAGTSMAQGTRLDIGGAGIGFVREEEGAVVCVSMPGNDDEPQWLPVGQAIPVNANNSPGWMHVGVRIDRDASLWDLRLDGSVVASGLPLACDNMGNALLMMCAGTNGPVLVDDLTVGSEEPEISANDTSESSGQTNSTDAPPAGQTGGNAGLDDGNTNSTNSQSTTTNTSSNGGNGQTPSGAGQFMLFSPCAG